MSTDRADVVTVEVGSTITKVNAFAHRDGALEQVGQGFAPTSVAEGDVGVGVAAAREDLRGRFGIDVTGVETHVNSSAAGGLRMSVHGLTASMTTRAAREASLGAGAIVGQVTAGRLTGYDLAELHSLKPNIVLLAGGVDYGERDIVIANARDLAAALGESPEHPPVVYAGNVAARPAVTETFAEHGVRVLVADNVFPDVDVLNVDPLRVLIHDVFSEHIVHAPGMGALAELTEAEVLPTPGAVLMAAERFAEAIGDVLVVDVGGATTDVHSVTDGSLELSAAVVEPEPRAKRTVEGDLGVYVNARTVAQASGEPDWAERLEVLTAMPGTDRERALTRWLAERAVEAGIRRHAGTLADIYTPTGKRQVVRGKDLTAVRWVVATGGALTKVPGAADVLRAVCAGPGRHLLPPVDAHLLVDDRYRFSALGTLARTYPDEVSRTLRRWADSFDEGR
ncbi:conserved hypothetical protein [Austwickia chelonae]|uniref:Methylaspartate mutase n=1 Tax=Austwickia chelonae NBRC 105200 TaxID=1184607 RepID=K6ULQ1_9MICO|nr:glutamate mutase L [Austwickia chelonae]GAB77446.1 hypothetical protein AUCHE_05_03580 [Austwickia chelonae NBRC 105200]SEW10603.1 conserved hypothetical protein [Austwickia chelonae]